MGTLVMTGQLLLALAVLVTVHEFGHFLAARMFGMRVDKFYLFFDAFNFKLFSWKKGETEYGIGWLPLGGYVKIAGMVDESLDKDQLKTTPNSWEFRAKPAWQRLIVLLGGIIMNLLLGLLIATLSLLYYGDSFLPNEAVNKGYGMYAGELGRSMGFRNGDKIVSLNGKVPKDWQELYDPDFLMADKHEVRITRAGLDTTITLPKDFAERIMEKGKGPGAFLDVLSTFSVSGVQADMGAARAGMKDGDSLLSVNGKDARFYQVFREEIAAFSGKEVSLQVLRRDSVLNLKARVNEQGMLGIQVAMTAYRNQMAVHQFGFLKAISVGTERSFNALYQNARGLAKVVSGEVKAKNALQGPVGIAAMYGSVWNWERFWSLTGILSLVLAMMNLLPIPALDGGHVVFTLWEMITGRPVNEKVLMVMQMIGMALIGALIVFIFWNDISRLLMR
jgi:regulator of sigma E protease